LIGRTLSHYEVTAKLGEGGMGEVYRATDTTLKREVALKVLPAEMASSPGRLERFQREAEAIAGLNHPNIVTIYSVEHGEGFHFLTMELIDGESLDRVLQRGGLPLPRVLQIARTIADALAVAHHQGIVHRDLKPANVMLTSDGRVKVLDFGLAKLARESSAGPLSEQATSMPTEVKPLTEEGVVLGTAPYMSPEQAQGLPADARSDIFSLGCLLYEASTGRRAFSGKSSIDTLHKVIHEEPKPLVEHAPEAPIQLQWILRKALAKDPADRYQSAGDMAVDLRATRKDLESDTALKTLKSGTAQPLERVAKARTGTTLAVIVAVLAGVAVLAWFLDRRGSDPPATTAQVRSIQPITSSGVVIAATISPDGKYVAYVESYQGRKSLHLRQLGSAQSLELIPPGPDNYWGLTFTPDSTSIAFGRKDQMNLSGALFQISTLGGTPKKLVEQMESAPSFSPDGSRFTWLRTDFPAPGASSLMIANADGSDEQVLATRAPPELLAPRFFTAPSWSPDGSLIAASVMSAETHQGRIVGFDVETGAVAWTSERSWNWISAVHWLPDGDGLLAIATPDDRPGGQIWYVPYPRGAPHQITDDLFRYRSVSLSADGNSLVTVADTFEAALWTRRRDGTGRPTRISHTRMDGRFGFDFTADGRIVLQTVEEGRFELAVMNLDGSGRQVLTGYRLGEFYPRITGNGRVLYCRRTPARFAGGAGAELRLMNLDGTESRTLSTVEGRYMTPALSPDGNWAVIPRASGLWRLPLDGSEPTLLTDLQAYLPAISPQGTRLAFYFEDGEQERIGILPIEGGELEATLEGPALTSNSSSLLRWAEDEEALIINTAPGDRANLWRLPLDGSEAQRLTDFTDETLFWFEYSPDGETLVVSSGQLLRDAVLIRDFR
jgi:serine/threonine protein kinase